MNANSLIRMAQLELAMGNRPGARRYIELAALMAQAETLVHIANGELAQAALMNATHAVLTQTLAMSPAPDPDQTETN